MTTFTRLTLSRVHHVLLKESYCWGKHVRLPRFLLQKSLKCQYDYAIIYLNIFYFFYSREKVIIILACVFGGYGFHEKTLSISLGFM